MLTNRKDAAAGFTLIELTLVIMVITVLAVIAIPHFGEALRTSNDGSTRANLGAIRKALSVYYSELDGQYPNSITNLTSNARHLKRVPAARLAPTHQDSAGVAFGAAANDGGGWLYNNTAGSANYGFVMVNCSHTDMKGRVWSTY